MLLIVRKQWSSLVRRDAEMLVGHARGLTAAGGAGEEALLDQEWLIDFFDRTALFAHGNGDRVQPDRPARKFLDDREQNALVHLVEPVLIDFERLQCHQCDLARDLSGALYLREVTGTREQSVRDT